MLQLRRPYFSFANQQQQKEEGKKTQRKLVVAVKFLIGSPFHFNTKRCNGVNL